MRWRLAVLASMAAVLGACQASAGGPDPREEKPVIEGPRTKEPVAPRPSKSPAKDLPKAPEYREGDPVRVMPDLRESTTPDTSPPAPEKEKPDVKQPAQGRESTPKSGK